MDDFEKVLATVALVATTFKAFTSGLKDIYDMTQGKEKATHSRKEETSQITLPKEVSASFTYTISHPLKSMKKMLKRIGYTNIALFIASTVILLAYVDFENPSAFDYGLIALYSLIILIHIARIVLFMFVKER